MGIYCGNSDQRIIKIGGVTADCKEKVEIYFVL